MLSISFPAAWWLGLVVIPIVIFYLLRMRFRKQPVSSIFLWSQLQTVNRGSSRLQPRSIWLLLLQILCALAAVLAVAEPFWNTSKYSKPGVIYLIDTSLSMSATEKNRSLNRLEKAKEKIAAEIEQQPPGAEGMIFLCSSGITPIGNPTEDHNKLLALLSSVRVGRAGFDETEVTEELQAWLITHKKPWRGVLVTDGGLDLGGRKLAGLFEGSLKIIPVGGSETNIGVTALRLIQVPQTQNQQMAQFQIYNGWPYDQQIQVYLEYNSQVIAKAYLKAERGLSNQSLLFPGPVQEGIYKIRLVQFRDAIKEDNQFLFAVNQPRHIRVLLVGNNNPFLRSVFQNSGLVDLTLLENFPSGNFNSTDWDLIVVDGVTVPDNLQCNLLSFGVAPPGKSVKIEKKTVRGELRNVNFSHPLLRFTDWAPVHILDGHSLKVDSGVQVLATVNGQPEIAAWEKEGWHYVVVGTDLYRSDLGLSGAFPVFIQNLLSWCVPQANNQLAYTLTVGENRIFAEPPAWQIINANYIKIKRTGPMLTLKPLQAGVFYWGQGVNRGFLTANPPAGELNITPRELNIPKTEPRLTMEYNRSVISLAGLTLVLLLTGLYLEWFLWRGLPKRKE